MLKVIRSVSGLVSFALAITTFWKPDLFELFLVTLLVSVTSGQAIDERRIKELERKIK